MAFTPVFNSIGGATIHSSVGAIGGGALGATAGAAALRNIPDFEIDGVRIPAPVVGAITGALLGAIGGGMTGSVTGTIDGTLGGNNLDNKNKDYRIAIAAASGSTQLEQATAETASEEIASLDVKAVSRRQRIYNTIGRATPGASIGSGLGVAAGIAAAHRTGNPFIGAAVWLGSTALGTAASLFAIRNNAVSERDQIVSTVKSHAAALVDRRAMEAEQGNVRGV